MADRQERAIVQAMFEEVQQIGKIIDALPPDDKAVRQLHAEEVLNTPLEQLNAQRPRKTGTKHGHSKLPRRHSKKLHLEMAPPTKVRAKRKARRQSTLAPRKKPAEKAPERPLKASAGRFYLEKDDPIGKAPSIGPKTAERLKVAGVGTVAELLAQDPNDLATKVSHSRITGDTIRLWQAQAKLAYQIPQIRGHDAQILVHCDITDPMQLAQLKPGMLLDLVSPFVESTERQRLIRSGKAPDLEEVTNWIEWAKQARE